MKSVLFALVSAIFLAVFAMPANAQATRTWISGVGDDANPCSRTAPCKTFAGAIAKTTASGEIDCLDPGGFGALTITKAITLKCDPMSNGGVLVSGTDGIVVAAGATDHVVLQGLDFEGLSPSSGPGLNGVNIMSAGAVEIINCVIRDFSVNGIVVQPSSGSIQVDIFDTVIFDTNGSSNAEGILIKPTGSANARVDIDRTRVSDSTGDGIMANANATSGNINLTVRNSESAHNGGDGFVAFSSTGKSQVMVDASTAFDNNGNGLHASGTNAFIRFTRTVSTGNTTGVSGGANAISYTSNSLDGNGTQGSFTAISSE